MPDLNKVQLSGLVTSQPILTKLASKTPFCTFTIQILEKFRDRNNVEQTKPNLIRVESLGRSAETNALKVMKGKRYVVDGYLRQDIVDGHESVMVRSFAVYPDESGDNSRYNEGLQQAMKILSTSRDLSSALEKIKELLESS